MTDRITIFHLEAKANEIESYAARWPMMNLILGAQENANDTHPDETAYPSADWHATAMGSLESLLSCETDTATLDWFRAQGVRW